MKDLDRKQKADFDASLHYSMTSQDNESARNRQLEREIKARQNV